MDADRSAIFQPIRINGVEFKNRLIRSSIGGRTAYYDGTVNEAWYTFEKRFASHGIGAIISATLTVDDSRWSPLEYPSLSHRRYVASLRAYIARIREYGCRYLIQLGDPGYHTQTSLVPEGDDGISASSGFDFLYGYTNTRSAMTVKQVRQTIRNFAEAADYVRDIGCDGLELTASKGYLIHQFLNPATNRRKDQYGGSLQNRARLLGEVVDAIRQRIGRDEGFVFGVRLSACDYSRRPWPALLRFGPWLVPSAFFGGNRLEDTLQIGEWLKTLGIDYLHISNGFGFINPMESPGRFPTDAVCAFADSTRHLSAKAHMRAAALNVGRFVLRGGLDRLLNIGWRQPVPRGNPANMVTSLDDARRFKETIGLPVIVNGGFQRREDITQALQVCDFVSMARPLLANPHLPRLLWKGLEPRIPCTFCNRCSVLTTLYPLGCYDLERYRFHPRLEPIRRNIVNGRARPTEEAQSAMERRISYFNRPP